MKLNNTMKKVVAILCSLALVVTSITVSSITSKADDGSWSITNSAFGQTDGKDWVTVYYSGYQGDTTNQYYYSVYIDEENENNRGKATNGWDWGKAQRNYFDTVHTTATGNVTLKPGTQHTIIVVAYSKDGDAYTRLDSVSLAITVPGEAVSEEDTTAYTQPTVDVENINDWVQLGDKSSIYDTTYYISTAARDTLMPSTAMRNLFNAGEGRYNCNMPTIPTLSYVCGSGTTGVIIDGITYTNDNVNVGYAGDSVHMNQALFQLPEGESSHVFIITVLGHTNHTYALKVMGEEAPGLEYDPSTVESWTKVPVPNSDVTSFEYYIPTDIVDTYINTGFNWGVFGDHTTTPYHDQLNCGFAEGSGAYGMIGKGGMTDMLSIWVDGTKYKSGTAQFCCVGDKNHIALDLFNLASGVSEHTFTLSLVKASLTVTYGVKVVRVAQEETTTTAVAAPKLDTPEGFVANINSSNQVYIAWANVAGATGYKLYVDDVYYDDIVNGANISVSEFAAGNHTFTVTAYDSTGVKSESDPTSGVLLNIPETETTTQASAVIKYEISVDGTKVADVEENGTYQLPATAQYGYYADGKMYKKGAEVAVTSEMSFTSVNTLSVSVNNKGAGIRTQSPAGLRFQAAIQSDNMEAVDSAAITEGMLITANDIYENNNSKLDLTTVCAKLNIVNSGWYDADKDGTADVGAYCGSIVNVVQSNYVRKFIAKAYVTVTYTDGESITVYSDMGPIRSISQVAKAVRNAGYPSLTQDEISTVDSFILD